jgi:hypothetical protein
VTSETARAIASFVIPPLTAVILLYQVLANLQIGFMRSETLIVMGVAVIAAVAAGALAAVGPQWVRIAIFALTTVLLLDMAVHLPDVFGGLHPEYRALRARDATRVADIHRLQAALEAYQRNVGPLPQPSTYGEAIGPSSFWRNYWDLSTHDGDGDGRYFLDFLTESGVVPSVPVDPVNETPDSDDPRSGFQYVYFVAPAAYVYEGGICQAAGGRSIYMLAVTRLESETGRPPKRFSGSGCECLWRDRPNYFQHFFDYVRCGTLTP